MFKTETTTTMLSDLPPAAEPASGGAGEEFVMPCAVSQQRFWVLDQLVSGNSALNIPLAVELKGPLEVEALDQALQLLIQRHETLRTTFAWIEDEVRQVITPVVPFHLQQKDLGGVAADAREETILKEMEAEAVRPLSLTQAPIFRARLLRLHDEHHVLLLTLHHIICDGWSNGVLVREIGQLYHATVQGKPSPLPELPIQYADYVLWQRDWLQTEDFRSQLDYWEQQWNGSMRALDFPSDHPRKVGRMYPSTIESLLLPGPLTERIKQRCNELDVTIFMIFFAMYVVLLNRYSGQARFMVGTTAANRTRPELENLIGQFANPMLLPCDVSDGPTFRELLFRVREQSLDAVSRQEVPFESIIEKFESVSGGREKPVIQAHFLFQKAFMHPAQYGELSIRPLRSVSPGTTFELMFGIVERGEGARLQMEYNTAMFEKTGIARMLRHFKNMLEFAIDNLDTPLGEIPLLTAEERALAWSAVPLKVDGAPTVDAAAIVEDLGKQLTAYFRDAEDPQAAPVETPPGALLAVLDANLRLLPFGVPGDVYLGGMAPETTGGRSLVTGPVDAPEPVPLLRTGFIGRKRDDGKVELLGRFDDFAQAGGFRVSLLQLRSLLAHHPDVVETAAAVVRGPDGADQLLCYVVPRPGATPLEKDLRALLKDKVADPAQPAQILVVASLPKDEQGVLVPELLPQPAQVAAAAPEDKMPMESLLYQQLVDIWTGLLKVPSVTVNDNFFALGGTSLLALRMMLQVEKLTGRALPLSLLLTGATIANLAQHIVASNQDALPLIRVQPKGRRQPIFFLHGDWAGGGFYCNKLSELLGDDQPFYVLPPYRSGKPAELTLEEMAAHHIAAIQEHTPRGPYILGGYCIGATVAREMARQLAAKGETITHVLLIDPPLWSPAWFRWAWPLIDRVGSGRGWDLQRKIYYFDRYCVTFNRWWNRSPRSKLESLCRRLGIKLPETATPAGGAPAGPDAEDEEILKSMDYAVYFLAYRLYIAQPSRVPTTLFFPESTLPERLAEVRRMAQTWPVKADVVLLPGDHRTCITKHTAPLMEAFRRALDRG